MPVWAQAILGAAAVATALGVLWTKVLRPFVRLVSTIEKMYPVAVALTETLGATPHAFDVLDEIVKQFRTDSGSSLRDAVNRLEEAAEANARSAAAASTAAEHLKVGVEASRLLAKDDRDKLDQLPVLLDRLSKQLDKVDASGVRIEADRAHVAEDLAATQDRAAGIEGDAGAAADAASQSPDPDQEV